MQHYNNKRRSPIFLLSTGPKYGGRSERFARVYIGMTESELLELLGEPIYKNPPYYSEKKFWSYTADGNAAPKDFAWRCRKTVILDGRVVDIHYHWAND